MKYWWIITMTVAVASGCSPESGPKSAQQVLQRDETRAEEFYYPTGALKRIDYYDGEDDVTRSVLYRPDGTRFTESRFKSGYGLDIHLHDNGVLAKVVEIQDGVANGFVHEFDSKGRHVESFIYADGRKTSEVTADDLKASSPQQSSRSPTDKGSASAAGRDREW